jgi:hypothetical protein
MYGSPFIGQGGCGLMSWVTPGDSGEDISMFPSSLDYFVYQGVKEGKGQKKTIHVK